MQSTICGRSVMELSVPLIHFSKTIPKRGWSDFRWNDTYEEDIAKATMYREELRVLRAFYLFELAKRYGDIPLLTRTYALDEINSVEKSSFSEVIKYICDECSDAAKHFPSVIKILAETGTRD